MAPSNEMLDPTVRQSGAFNVDADQVLSATVLSLRNENKLMVRTFLGEAGGVRQSSVEEYCLAVAPNRCSLRRTPERQMDMRL